MSSLLELRNLGVSFSGHEAVRGLNLTIAAGETLALVGESGSGKSATALAIMRLLPPQAVSQGQILFGGQDLLTLPPAGIRALRGQSISMIFQEPMISLNPVLSIGQQLTEVLHQHQVLSHRAARDQAIALLDRVKIARAASRIDDYPHHLSGGQRQRVMIAMAVACRPRLLIADEPTTALDMRVQAQILELLDELRREYAMSLLLISHDLGLVGQWADRVAVMYAGKKLEDAPTRQIFSSPAHSYTRALLGTTLHWGARLHYRQNRLPEMQQESGADGEMLFQLVPAAVGRSIAPVVSQDKPILSLMDIQTRYPGQENARPAVDGISFDIQRGETVGLVGESGCGKSTLSKTILRLLEPSAGKLVFDGQDITHAPEASLRPLRHKVQMIFQDPYASLNPRHSVETILDRVLRAHGMTDKQARRQRALQTLDHVGLPSSSLQRFPHEFSGGQRQRIGIARALILRPALVICDEPVSALDASIQAQILNLLVDLKREYGLSYLFISHDLSVISYMADRVLVMHQGRCVDSGSHDALWNQPAHPYTRSLLAAMPAIAFAPVAAPGTSVPVA